MRKEITPVDISNSPELLKLAQDVRTSGAPRLLRDGEQDLAMLTPVQPSDTGVRSRGRRDRRTSADDPLWNIIGIGDAAGSPDDPTDVSENKYKYLAEAYEPPRA